MSNVILPRHVTAAVLHALDWSPVVLVEGARQSGKSVLARELVSGVRPAHYVTLDDSLALASALDDPQSFAASLPLPVIIDEVQRAPELFRAIKLVVDRDRRPGQFLLTGSANVLLLPKLSDSLAGRMRIITLWPLSQSEIDGTEGRFIETVFAQDPLPPFAGEETRAGYAKRIVRGGFPEPVGLPAGHVRDGWMQAYITTLLERDVREIAAITDRVALPRLLRLLAVRSGTLLNSADLSRATGIARATLDRYLALFAKVFALQLVPAWSGDVGRRLIKSPKLLFVDPGVAAHLAGVDAKRLLDDPDRLGTLTETFVGAEILRCLSHQVDHYELMHFRDGNGNEVDWVIEDAQGRLVGVEVKAATAPHARDFKGLRAFAAAVGDRFHRGVVLHTGTTAAPMGERMWALPIDTLWRL